ncbi:rickettsial conserved hypothetical protein [Rickettsia typhi str. Wilmington]|uniref:Uncharacterized protein n=2 Tax=Rickettsia typhi TaxID=785 RepID=Q68WS1_RICTY|nr:rickettsial conserved hypothetical protein [Rickettsia typhi str. Wilmington]AFE54302.1 hypothetical protein RTTH1527_02185 [Rickettsia typhi str. TH1527]AFE55142.1 hypothetical protein RTB9991CWPP_02195 [Rickettsia typhi str. B9991CWPP]
MNIKLVIYFLILVNSLKVNADLNHIQDSFEYQKEQLAIELPWSDCTAIHKFLEEKLFFSEQQIKKENKIHEKYKQFYLQYNNKLSDFSMHFLDKNTEINGVETLISGFLKFCEDNFQTNKSKTNFLNFFQKQQDQWLHNIRNENYKTHYRKNMKIIPLEKLTN